MLRRLVSFIITFVLANTIIGLPVLTATASDMNAKNFEELRDNLVEVRLALQKGDLTEALQHLNNAEEQLLLFEENVTAHSTIPQLYLPRITSPFTYINTTSIIFIGLGVSQYLSTNKTLLLLSYLMWVGAENIISWFWFLES